MKKRRNKFTVKSGRRILGKIEKIGQFGWVWKGTHKQGGGDRGITTSLRNAKAHIERDSGMSPRMYEIKVHRDK